MEKKLIGQLSQLWRYPVKSMAGEKIYFCEVTEHGLVGDRNYGILRSDKDFSDRPSQKYLTARIVPELLQFKPKHDRGHLLIYLPEDYPQSSYPIEHPDLHNIINNLYDKCDLSLENIEEGCPDNFPLSLVSYSSLNKFDQKLEESGIQGLLNPQRFRKNFIVDWKEDIPFYEDSLLGQHIQIGENGPVLQVEEKIRRCAMITIDPDSLEKDKQYSKNLVDLNKFKFGIYLSVVQPGIVKRDNPIYLL